MLSVIVIVFTADCPGGDARALNRPVSKDLMNTSLVLVAFLILYNSVPLYTFVPAEQ